ncbi:rCG61198 [Rattus norvegicus]|uniref:RCG61198 n=1 Tax=Rattus norvegicus TaxID=10116 RepID=A6KE03_RAT|nr:rCG61198 [Rattus norvegicus]
MENSVLGLHDHRSYFLMWGVWHMFQTRNLAGSGELSNS